MCGVAHTPSLTLSSEPVTPPPFFLGQPVEHVTGLVGVGPLDSRGLLPWSNGRPCAECQRRQSRPQSSASRSESCRHARRCQRILVFFINVSDRHVAHHVKQQQQWRRRRRKSTRRGLRGAQRSRAASLEAVGARSPNPARVAHLRHGLAPSAIAARFKHFPRFPPGSRKK